MDRKERALSRANWPGAKLTLEENLRTEVWHHGSAAARFEAVWQLTLNAWAMSAKAIPSYARAEMPGRVIRSKIVK